jgi:hypothetical protein
MFRIGLNCRERRGEGKREEGEESRAWDTVSASCPVSRTV